MVLITSLAIEEAAETLTEDGGRFGDTLFGGQVIEAARALLKQQTEDQGPPLPLGEFFETQGGYGPRTLAVDPGRGL